MSESTPSVHPVTLLNLGVVTRMMLADGHIAAEELAILQSLVEGAELDDPATNARVGAWMQDAPDDAVLAKLAEPVDEEDRREALALAWIVALSDSDLDAEEVSTFESIAAALDSADAAEETRTHVEDTFYGQALTVLAGVAIMANLADSDDEPPSARKADHYREVIAEVGLPNNIEPQAHALLAQPLALHTVLSNISSLDMDFQEALLGNLWANACSDGDVNPREHRLYGRFIAASRVQPSKAAEIQAEWGPDLGA